MSLTTIVRLARVPAAALWLAGCGLVTDPDGTPRVALTFQQTDDTGIVAPGARVTEGGVEVRGTFSTPCLGYAIQAGATRNGGAVEVTLRGRQQGEACLTAIGRFPYTATVSGVAPGSRRVIVRHVIADANWPVETVIDTTLLVP